jgi:hypothetical protein
MACGLAVADSVRSPTVCFKPDLLNAFIAKFK